MTRGRIYLIAAIAAILGVIADQGSKWALLEIVGLRENPRNIRILPVFDIVMWWNQGTSFSLFRTGEAWGPYIFSIAALAIIGILVLWLSRIVSPILAAALGAVIGGALGNVVDRLRFGAVADFFYAHLGEYGWPAFNIADSLIVVGIGVLVFDGMFLSHKTDKMARRKQP
ncbi:MAG: lspA [Rhodospirillales bacterium]|jgi:signal peptidase II|nr:lspA [Rhodospirillales bacterium]